MKYLILIHQHRGAREQFASFTPTMQAEGLAAYQKLNADLVASGEYVAGEALDSDTSASVVRGAEGTYVVTDGPFAETKEMLAGFYLVDVASRDRAVEIAGLIPEVQAGAADIEVRPVMSYDWPDQ
ncbi:MAG TPA: YciI family protein [Propionibacteriaceae bacterium]|nr:YciI family protein [Propionibacteriaceae bacterium]